MPAPRTPEEAHVFVGGVRPESDRFFTIFADGLHSQSKKRSNHGILQGVQGIRPQGQRNGHGRRRHHRRRVRQDRVVARERYHHAARRGPARQHRLQPPAHRPLAHPRPLVAGHARRGGHAHPGCRHLGGEDGRSRGTGLVELRRLHPAVR